MQTNFKIHGISGEPFAALFERSDAALAERGIRRVLSDGSGCPCRVSLQDVAQGTELLLLNFAHQTANSPYQSSAPIYVSRGATQADLPTGVVPLSVTQRLISLRAYDAAHMIVDAEVCEGVDVAAALHRHFKSQHVAYIYLHNAKRGCYACRVERA